jgi:hypothetical protein
MKPITTGADSQGNEGDALNQLYVNPAVNASGKPDYSIHSALVMMRG